MSAALLWLLEWSAGHNGALLAVALVALLVLGYLLWRVARRVESSEAPLWMLEATRHAPGVLVKVGPNYCVQANLGRALERLGYAEGGNVGKDVRELLGVGPAAEVAREAYRRCVEGRERQHFRRRHVDRAGREAVLDYWITPYADGGCVLWAYDVTDMIHRAEQAEAEADTLRGRVARLEEVARAERVQAMKERSLGIRLEEPPDALLVGVPDAEPYPDALPTTGARLARARE